LNSFCDDDHHGHQHSVDKTAQLSDIESEGEQEEEI
jgi:hypothetical protein